MLKRNIYISLSILKDAIQDKDVLEALAFALMIKRTFIDSVIRNATIRQLKNMFHMGSDKMERVLKNAIDNGFIERDGNNLIAKKLRDVKELCIKYTFSHKDKTFVPIIECDVTIQEVVKSLQAEILLNHINIQHKTVDAYKKQVNPSNLKEYKKARRRGKLLKGAYATLSIARICQLLTVSPYKARKILRTLLSEDAITMSETIIKTGININDFTKDAQRWMKENEPRGFFYADHRDKCVYMKTANTYTPNINNVRYCI